MVPFPHQPIDVRWTPWVEPGIEHLRLTITDHGILAEGAIVSVWDGEPARLRYRIRCDAAWRVRSVRIGSLGTGGARVHLDADGEGRWTDETGARVPTLDGCLDVDIAATPFTNTLPIRRLGLRPGDRRDIAVAYVAVPGLAVSREPQRYECIEARADGARHRFTALDGGFTTELPTDADGMVEDYPLLFRRVWQR